MNLNEPLFDAFGFVAAVVVVLVDRRRAVILAAVAAAVGLAPTTSAFGGIPAALILLLSALGAGVAGSVARALSRRRTGPGFDPVVPVFTPAQELFGPRSMRLVAAAIALPAASWISYNVPIGATLPVRGLLFPVAFVWAAGAVRLLLARTIEDLATGVAVTGLAGASAWVVRGFDPLAGELTAAALAPLAAVVADWVGGRQTRRRTEAEDAGAAA